MKNNNNLFIIPIILLVLVLGPLVGIWVVNILFDVNNPYDFSHWLAVVLAGFLTGGIQLSYNK